MKLFPESPFDYLRVVVAVLILWIAGVGVAFIPEDLGKNLSTGIGLGNALISLIAVILVVSNCAHQLALRQKDDRREQDSVIQTHFFQISFPITRLAD
jgi:hypothetical protein